MMSRTHKICGGTAAFVATTAVGMPPILVASAVGWTYAGSSLPDDAEKVIPFVKHRGLTHIPSVQVAFFAALAYAASRYEPAFTALFVVTAASLAFGCIIHSVVDGMTIAPGGIQYLWPIRRRGYRLMRHRLRVRVGANSRSERRFLLIWWAFVLIYSYARFRHLILA
jgi:hypothetical protein